MGEGRELTARLHQMCFALRQSKPSMQPPFTETTSFPGVEWITRVPQDLQKKQFRVWPDAVGRLLRVR